MDSGCRTASDRTIVCPATVCARPFSPHIKSRSWAITSGGADACRGPGADGTAVPHVTRRARHYLSSRTLVPYHADRGPAAVSVSASVRALILAQRPGAGARLES